MKTLVHKCAADVLIIIREGVLLRLFTIPGLNSDRGLEEVGTGVDRELGMCVHLSIHGSELIPITIWVRRSDLVLSM